MQQSHEYLQWTSAISLGIITRNCSGSEWRLKMEISNCLLQVQSKLLFSIFVGSIFKILKLNQGIDSISRALTFLDRKILLWYLIMP